MTEPLIVSRHAMDRFRERVANLPDRQIFERLSTPIFELAVELGASAVRLPSGHRAVIKNTTVLTVLPKQEVHHSDQQD